MFLIRVSKVWEKCVEDEA